LMAAAIRRFTGMNFTDLGKKVFESEDWNFVWELKNPGSANTVDYYNIQ
jgi:hypothetical protein